jgi:autotransporter translocation and assembly factor TamB
MARIKSRKAKVATYLGSAVLVFGVLFFLLRGPYLSNNIKRIIIPVLENATRERIIIDKAVINLFPFYVQAKGFKLLDKDGNRLLWITKTRVYIDLLGLLSKEIRIRKLTLKEPDLTVSDKDLQRIMANLKKSVSAEEEGEYRISLKNIKLTKGSIVYDGDNGLSLNTGRTLSLDMATRNKSSTFTFLLKSGTVKLPNNSELDGSLKGKIKVEDKKMHVAELNIKSSDSSLSANGEIFLADAGTVREGSLSVKARIYGPIINKIFNLEQEKDAELSLEGPVRLVENSDSKWPDFVLDLKTDSQFYLETLMEIIEVNENIKGKVSLKGTITGTFPDISGSGTARLENAVLGTLPIDDAAGEIAYENNRVIFRGITAHTFNGIMKGGGHIVVTNGDYAVDADASDIDSDSFFNYIEWKAPFPEGKLEGSFILSQEIGHDIDIAADVIYRNTSKGEGDVLARLQSARTTLELRENILLLKDALLSTEHSDLYMDGIVNLDKETLALDLDLGSDDGTDLIEPYYEGFSAPITFEGTLSGPVEAPELKGEIKAEAGSVHGVDFTEVYSDITYQVNSLSAYRMMVRQDDAVYDVSGSIEFEEAEELFSFDDPYFRIKAEIENVDVDPFIKLFDGEMLVSGRASGMVSFEGNANDFESKGNLVVSDGDIYSHKIDKVTVDYQMDSNNIKFQSVKLYKGESSLEAKGTLSFNGDMNISVSSNQMYLHDFPVFKDSPFDLMFGLDVTGTGTMHDPELQYSVSILKALYEEEDIGTGKIQGSVNNKKLQAQGIFFDGLIIADGGADFSDKITWGVTATLKQGNYEYLISSFARGLPEDLTASLEGTITLEGQDREYTLHSEFSSANISLYGYDLRNNGDIIFSMMHDELLIESFSMADENAGLTAVGTVTMHGNYDLTASGYIDISPLSAVNDAISSSKGRCDFAFGIQGPWNRPEVLGEINITDASAVIEDFPYTIGPANGTIFLRKDRLTFHSLHVDFASGDIILTGAGYLEDLDRKRFFISADINDVKIKPIDGLRTAFGGRLFYEYSPKGKNLTGNIDIKKAKYTKRIEWKSWLLGLKEIERTEMEIPEIIGETALNIHVTGAENIVINNNIARTPVKMVLNVMGTIANIALLGRVEANEGTVYFRSNEFNILEGTNVNFVDPEGIVTVFHIIADTYIQEYYVRLSLDGTVDDFALSLVSDPPLTETEIVTLLAFGQVRKGGGIESGIAAGEATAIITGGLHEAVEEEFGYLMEIDRLEVEPHVTKEGSLVPKITVGKRLFEDKLFVIYSSAIGTAEENLIRLEYKLNNSVSLLGERNELGSLGGGVKYKFKFR